MLHRAARLALLPLLAASCAPAPSPPPPASSPAVSRPPSACDLAAADRALVPSLLAEGRLDRAVRTVAGADARCPSSAAASWEHLLPALIELGRYREARDLARRVQEAHAGAAAEAVARIQALEQLPADPGDARRSALREVARAAETRGDAAAVRAAYLDLWSLRHPDGEALVRAAAAAEQLGDAAGARRLYDRGVAELEAQTGAPLWLEPVAAGGDRTFVYAPDNRRIAMIEAGWLHILDRATHREVRRLVLQTDGRVTGTAFSPDGKRLSVVFERPALVHEIDLEGLTVVRHAWGGDWDPDGVHYGPGGARILVTSRKGFRVWSVPGGELRAEVDVGGAYLKTIVPSPDGRVVAMSFADQTIRLVAADTGATLGVLTGTPALGRTMFDEEGLHFDLAFSPDGKTLASLRYGSGVHLWDVARGVKLHALDWKDTDGGIVRFEDGGRTVVTRTHREYSEEPAFENAWDVRSGRRIRRRPAPPVSFDGDGCPQVEPPSEGTMVIRGAAGAVKRVAVGEARNWRMACAPDGAEVVTQGDDGPAIFWSTASGAAVARIETEPAPGSPDAFAFSPAGDVAALAASGVVDLVALATGKRLAHLPIPDTWELAFSPDGSRLVTAGRDEGHVIDVARAIEIASFPAKRARSLAVSHHGRTAAIGGENGVVYRFDLARNEMVRQTIELDRDAELLAFGPDDREIVALVEKRDGGTKIGTMTRRIRLDTGAVSTFDGTIEELLPGFVSGTTPLQKRMYGHACRDPEGVAEGAARVMALKSVIYFHHLRADCRAMVVSSQKRPFPIVFRLPDGAPLHELHVMPSGPLLAVPLGLVADVLGDRRIGGGRVVRLTDGRTVTLPGETEVEEGDLVPLGEVEPLGQGARDRLLCRVGERVLPLAACADRRLVHGVAGGP